MFCRNRRIARLTRLTHELGQSQTPEETFRALHRALADLHGFAASALLSTTGLPAGHYRVLRVEPEDESRVARGPAHAEPDVVRSGGVMAAIIARPQPQLIDDVDWSDDPHFRETLGGCSSVMAIPLAGSRLPMMWAIVLKRPPERFAEADLEEAVESGTLIGALLENQSLAGELARAHEKIDRDARQVGDLQRALLPASPPRIVGLEVASSYEPSGRAGGDLYDFFPLDEPDRDPLAAAAAPTRWCALMGDASGHGLAAAVVMAIVQGVLHAHPAGIDRPAALLAHANRHLCARPIGGFLTAFLGVYEPASRRLTYANAGHPAPLLKRSSDGSIQSLDAAVSYPLGIDGTESFQEATVQLQRGDTVLLYTDGITESRTGPDDLFGRERLTRVMRESCGGPAGLIDRLRAAVAAHEHGQPAPDDQTLVAARVR
jgi:sigma-B regulation protein RsbU (phosphoserine phosphatase)